MNVTFSIRPYELPLRAPLRIGDIELRERKGWLICARDSEGGEGWGDVAPLPGLSRESGGEVEHALQMLVAARSGVDPRAVPWPVMPSSVQCGLEMALYQLGRPDALPPLMEGLIPWRNPLPVSGLLREGENLEAEAERMRREGYRTVKIKVGRADVEQDIARVHRFAGIAGRDVALRLDANRGWTFDEAAHAAAALRDIPVEYFEEPLREPARLMEWQRLTGAPLALDETLMELAPEELVKYAGLTAVVLKPTVLGGLSRALAFAHTALCLRAYPVISAVYESGVGIAALARFAMALGGNAAAGLDTYRALASDVLKKRLPLPAPWVQVDDTRIDGI